MTMKQFISNLYYTFGIMGFTHDEINIIIRKSIKSSATSSRMEDYLYD